MYIGPDNRQQIGKEWWGERELNFSLVLWVNVHHPLYINREFVFSFSCGSYWLLLWWFIQTSVFLKWDYQILSNHLLFAVQSMIQWRSSGFSHERGVHELHLLFLILKSLWQGILSQSTLIIITISLSSLVLTRWWYLPAVVEDVPVRSRINRCLKYWPCTTKYQPLLSLLTQYMTLSPRNTQSSQMNLVCSCFDTMMIFASLGWTSRD